VREHNDIEIIATAPDTWASDLSEGDATFFAVTFFNSAIGLAVQQSADGVHASNTGGQPSMVRIVIAGTTGLSWPALRRIVRALGTVGQVERAVARSAWRDIDTSHDVYSAEDVLRVLNRAADDILEAADLPDTGTRDALNLLVNAAFHYLGHPEAELQVVIDANYDIGEGEDGPLEWMTE
jgi:hypothetical protein